MENKSSKIAPFRFFFCYPKLKNINEPPTLKWKERSEQHDLRIVSGVLQFLSILAPLQISTGSEKMNETAKRKVRFKISKVLLADIERTLKPNETLDARLTHLLLRGLNIEGLQLEGASECRSTT